MLDAGCPMSGWRQKRVTRPRGAGEQIVNVREGFGVCCGVAREWRSVCLNVGRVRESAFNVR